MTMTDVYRELSVLQSIVWMDDDLMTQETLFEVQDRLADLVAAVAIECGKKDELLRTFPWLYRVKGE